jgi:hypothetical protein
MTTERAAAALVEVRGLAAAGRIQLSSHARARCRERGVLFADVRAALTRARGCVEQDHGRWRVVGDDLGGEELTAVVVLEDGVLVVTLF